MTALPPARDSAESIGVLVIGARRQAAAARKVVSDGHRRRVEVRVEAARGVVQCRGWGVSGGARRSLRKQIVQNVIRHVKKDGFFLYITCSVFKKENEEVVEFIQRNSELELIKKELLKGYDKKADTMFAALFKKNS